MHDLCLCCSESHLHLCSSQTPSSFLPALHYSDKEMAFEVLPNCASYIQVKLKRVTDGGDHDVAICEVVGTGIWDGNKHTVIWLSENDDGNQSSLDPSSALYSGQLRGEGII